ncbi:hypothetical protein GEMRC1_005000 [Eukaryota sp. GEM-RC1]
MKAVATRISCGFVGCASHRFQLGVRQFTSHLDTVFRKINTIMKLLSEPKRATVLNGFTKLKPKKRNVTRWHSTEAMVRRYIELKDSIVKMIVEAADQELLQYLPSSFEEPVLLQALNDLENLAFVSLQLQREDIDMLSVQRLFASTIDVYCQENENPELKEHLTYPASLRARYPENQVHFETAVLKLLRRGECLTEDEKKWVQCFIEHPNAEPRAGERRLASIKDVFSQKTIEEGSTYQDLSWIPPTSNVVERLFSRVRFIQGLNRHSLSQERLETQVFLSINRHHWDMQLVAKMIVDRKLDL